MNRFITGLCLAACLVASTALAEQRLSVRADRKVSFHAAAGGVTRISVSGDRIRKLIHDDSAFETMNDEETGDVFMRYVGDQSKLAPETGHIITESGTTIPYEITPRISADAETVVITITGGAKNAAASAPGVAPAPVEPPPFLDDSTGAGDSGGYSDTLVTFLRKTIVRHIGRKAPPKSGNGTVIASEKSGGLRAKVIVARVGAGGGLVRPQAFYGSRVVAVWVDRQSLGPNERTWVVVVEKSK